MKYLKYQIWVIRDKLWFVYENRKENFQDINYRIYLTLGGIILDRTWFFSVEIQETRFWYIVTTPSKYLSLSRHLLKSYHYNNITSRVTMYRVRSAVKKEIWWANVGPQAFIMQAKKSCMIKFKGWKSHLFLWSANVMLLLFVLLLMQCNE